MTQLTLCLTEMKREWITSACADFPNVKARLPHLITTDELHTVYPEPKCKNWWGSLTAKLAKVGAIEDTGERRASKRPERNGAKITLWRVVG